MLYELIAIGRPGRVAEIKELVQTTGSIILAQKGVIRSIANWGTYLLPKPIGKAGVRYAKGHHFLMRFDAAPSTQAAVCTMLKTEQRILRFGIVKVGDGTLASNSQYTNIRWTRKDPGHRLQENAADAGLFGKQQ